MLPKMPFTKIIMLNYLNAIKKPARNEREQKNCRLKELSAYLFLLDMLIFPIKKRKKKILLFLFHHFNVNSFFY